MNLFEVIKLDEATAPLKLLNNDMALMTFDEYIKFINQREAYHSSNAYDWSLEDMNERHHKHSSRLLYDSGGLQVGVRKSDDGNADILLDWNTGETLAIVVDGTSYYSNPKYKKVGMGDLNITDHKRVKYMAPLLKKVNAGNEVIDRYSKVLGRKRIGNEYFELRALDGYDGIAIFNDSAQKVGVAQDEWGATLIVVAKEYRGRGLDQWLAKVWYESHPDMDSGGLTPQGKAHSRHTWANRVRKFLSNGWYDQLVRNGDLSMNRLREILADLPKRKTYIHPKEKSSDKAVLRVYVSDTSFILYDSKFLESRDEEDIKAYGFLRSTGDKNDEIGVVYRLDYEEQYRVMAHLIIFQLARDVGYSVIDVNAEASDVLELDDIGAIEVMSNGTAQLKTDVMDLTKLSAVEKAHRKRADSYGEIEIALIELAELSREWDV